jgi:acetyl esterase/lipase
MLLVVFNACLTGPGFAQQTDAAPAKAPQSFANIPTTISPEAQAILRLLPNPAHPPFDPQAGDLEGWKIVEANFDKMLRPASEATVNRLKPEVIHRSINGIPVVEVRPKGWKDNGKVVVYTHGGAYVQGSADDTLIEAAILADEAGLRIISVDYTLAPFAKWDQTTDAVVAVVQGVAKEVHGMSNIGMFGESAGGGLILGSILKLRDKGLGMPAVAVVWSPWTDLTGAGDSHVTLKNADPIIDYAGHANTAAEAYANLSDQKIPYASPVYGDYSKGFPPTLIQGGTKEVLLSDFIREYQALDNSGQVVKLDLYEGMFHGFQLILGNAPEAKIARKKTRDFLLQYLGK